MNKLKDVAWINTTYSYALNENIGMINALFEDRTVNTEQYRDYILTVIRDANDSPAKRKFVSNLLEKTSKYELLFYTTNALLKGSGFGV